MNIKEIDQLRSLLIERHNAQLKSLDQAASILNGILAAAGLCRPILSAPARTTRAPNVKGKIRAAASPATAPGTMVEKVRSVLVGLTGAFSAKQVRDQICERFNADTTPLSCTLSGMVYSGELTSSGKGLTRQFRKGKAHVSKPCASTPSATEQAYRELRQTIPPPPTPV